MKKELEGMAEQFKDPNYLDSLSAEAEEALKLKFQKLNQEMVTQENQYYQILNQANMQFVQGIAHTVNKAAKTIAANRSLDLIVDTETCFYYLDKIDVTEDVINEMDRLFSEETSKVEEKGDATR
jgi:Skp family chaperone for outer membrane proteins